MRKLKKKPTVLCEGCHAREIGSSSIISNSQKSIRGLNLSEIIDQTEKVFYSTKRVESIINRHDSGFDSSIHLFPSRTVGDM